MSTEWPQDLKITMIVCAILDGITVFLGIWVILALIAGLTVNFLAALISLILWGIIYTAVVVRFVVFVSALGKEFSAESAKRVKNIRILTTVVFTIFWVVILLLAGTFAIQWNQIVEYILTGLIWHFATKAEGKEGTYTAA